MLRSTSELHLSTPTRQTRPNTELYVGNDEVEAAASRSVNNIIKRGPGNLRLRHREPVINGEEPPPKRRKPQSTKGLLPAIPDGEIPTDKPSGGGKKISIRDTTPWEQYEEVITLLDFNNAVIWASQRGSPGNRVRIVSIPDDEKAVALSWFLTLEHTNVVAAHELFQDKFIRLEEMHISLVSVVQCPRQRTSEEIGTIIGQILDGLIYMETQNFFCEELTVWTVEVHDKGDVKIAFQDHSVETTLQAQKDARTKTLNDIRVVVEYLMLGCRLDKAGDGFNIDDQGLDIDLLTFHRSIESSPGLAELRNNPFLTNIYQKRWPKEILCDLIFTAQMMAHRDYDHKTL